MHGRLNEGEKRVGNTPLTQLRLLAVAVPYYDITTRCGIDESAKGDQQKSRDTHIWLEPCINCSKKHYMKFHDCPECQGRGGQIPTPVSERVYLFCGYLIYDRCAGCDAYRDHLQ